MQEKIIEIASQGDSVGGILETVITGLPAGVGEPWFDSIESLISHAVFGIPAVKGIEFGAGFSICDMLGSAANDSFVIKDGKVLKSGAANGILPTLLNSGGLCSVLEEKI